MLFAFHIDHLGPYSFTNVDLTEGEDDEEVEESLVARGVPILVAGRRQQECQHLLIGATCHGGEVGGVMPKGGLKEEHGRQ